MYRFIHSTVLCFLFLCFAGFGFAADKPTVFVSVLPQKFFLEKLAGNFLNVEVMVLPGASPATYEPKSSQMRKISSALAYFAIGVPFEQSWLERIAALNREMKIIHTDEGIEKRVMASHHESHEHSAGGDPHIWLSPTLVKTQINVISTSLTKILPEHAGEITDNKKGFIAQIDALDAKIKAIMQSRQGQQFMVFHPTWGYFAEAYGLEQIAIEVEGKKPKPAQLQALITFARDNGITVVFVQPQFSTKSAKLIAREIGGTVLPLDPLAENWLENMKIVADKFKEATH
jgi:zinc transport system substrate-binding protein